MTREMTTQHEVPIALTIAGSDPSGGAGLQADLKTFHQHGVYGAAAVTLLTVQNTQGVTRVEPLTGELVRQQVEAVLQDLDVSAIKFGALGSAEIIHALAEVSFRAPLIIDPVMVSKHGHRLLSPDAERALVERLFPLATLVTPNAHEAAALWGSPVDSPSSAERAAKSLAERGPKAVLVKGGHVDGAEAVDVLWAEGRWTHFPAPRVASPHTHGTGCTLSAAITAWLARGETLDAAVRQAKAWLTRAIEHPPRVGKGIGPVDHFTAT